MRSVLSPLVHRLAIAAVLALITLSQFGCTGGWRGKQSKKTKAPWANLNPLQTPSTSPGSTGIDYRARQIERNLGVR